MTQQRPAAIPPNENRREAEASAVADGSGRSVQISFSSEEPYLRSFGYEVLSHADGAVDLSRLNSIGVLLYNHDRDRVLGRIDRAWIEGGRGLAVVTFDTDADADLIFQKVQSGTLKGVSVGYSVTRWEETEAAKQDKDGAETAPATWTAAQWAPYEVSIVSVPADASVGVGREGYEDGPAVPPSAMPDKLDNIKFLKQGGSEMTDLENKAANAAEPAADAARAVEAERARIRSINSICADFGVDADAFVADGSSVDAVRAAVLDQLKAKKAPARVQTVEDEGDKFRAAASDALAMRAGVKLDKPAAGARDLAGMNLKALAAECLVRGSGMSDAAVRRMSADDIYSAMARDFINPSAAFPAIMDAAVNKAIVTAYQAVPTTFEAWTTTGSLSDFKESKDHLYTIGGGSFDKVPESGELTASKPATDLLPTRRLDTYGTQFTMSRQAFVNDDIGFISQLPAVYAQAAKRKINRQVYETLFSAAKIFDSKTLFHADHGNLVTTGAAPSLETINALMVKLQAQKDAFGEAINVMPRTLLVPVGYGLMVDTILHSTSVNYGGNAYTGYNPLAGRGLQVVEDATLNALAGSGACPWFLVADPTSAKSIQVDYLNGIQAPTIRRSEKVGQLGMVWDIFMDWGVSVVDYRGIAKNAGVQVKL